MFQPLPPGAAPNHQDMGWLNPIARVAESRVFNLVIMALIAWIFYQKTERLESSVSDCQKSRLEYFEQNSDRMTKALESNTKAFEELREQLNRKR